MSREITFGIIGAGNGGQAIAGYLGLQKQKVKVYDINTEVVEKLNEKKEIHIYGKINGLGKISLATNCISDVVLDSDVIMIVTPATSHKEVAKQCSKFLTNEQIVILVPGSTGGAIEFYKQLKTYEPQKDITVAETQSLFYACRNSDVGVSNIFAVKKQLPLSAIPNEKTPYVISLLHRFFPQLTSSYNAFQTSLNNINPILHPTPVLLNIGMIDRKQPFLFYLEGITPGIAEVIEQLDEERVNIGEALGIEMKTSVNWLQTFYNTKSKNIYQAVQENNAYKEIKAPKTLYNRFLFEDIPMGLIPMLEIGELAGVQAPKMRAIFELSKTILGEKILKDARNLHNLDIKNVNEIQ